MAGWAVLTSFALLVLRLWLARDVGFGDAEALYASYAMHPQPAYLDHPGLIGFLARAIGGGTVPRAAAAHVFTAVASTLLPWVGAACARATGAEPRAALRTFFALALAPETAVGLFALTPDLPLAFTWLIALGLAALALRADAGGIAALAATLGSGAAVGLACNAKASGVLLGGAIAATSLSAIARRRWRTVAPWAAGTVAAILVAPLVLWEARNGLPLLRHRLIDTQAAAGFSPRNAGALVGGQIAYVTPPFLWAAWIVLRDLFRRRGASEVDRLLWLATIVPATALGILCCWSRVAEPHWMAPAYLAVAIHASRVDGLGDRLGRIALATGAAVVLLAWILAATPIAATALGSAYRPRYDLTNDLYAWRPGERVLRDSVEEVRNETGRVPVVIGPHWIVCAQAHAALGPSIPVACLTPSGDDFQRWQPSWSRSPTLLFVTDDRFGEGPSRTLGDRVATGSRLARVTRGDRTVRTIFVTRFDRRADVAQR